MNVLVLVWRAHARRARRAVWVLTLTIAVVGGGALATLAGARRTASTFAAYERNVRLSDLAVNTFEPDLKRVAAIARAPGVKSSATYVGLTRTPWCTVASYETFATQDSLAASMDGSSLRTARWSCRVACPGSRRPTRSR